MPYTIILLNEYLYLPHLKATGNHLYGRDETTLIILHRSLQETCYYPTVLAGFDSLGFHVKIIAF